MQIWNTNQRFGSVAIFLHWVMAILLIGLVVLGLYMTRIPISLEKLKMYGWHKEYGIIALFLVMLRIVWRLGNILPTMPITIPQWQQIAARLVHWAFYIFMFALPITGWLITSAAGLPVSVFGWFVLPNLIAPNETQRMLFQQIHQWLGYGLIVVFCMHVAAALKHHFINKDDILRRML